jgi:CMP-N,N'-diacetyllegionaminic acid synthase
MKIVGLVPARKNSQGLLNKNIRPLNGKPLISYSIESAIKCKYIDTVYVNSDSQEYIDIGESYGAKPFLRPVDLADNETPMINVIKNFLEVLKNKSYDALIVLYPVYPLRTSAHLDKMIEFFMSKINCSSLVGIKKPSTHPFLCYERMNSGSIRNIMKFDEDVFYRRQDYPLYHEITHWACILSTGLVGTLNNQLISQNTYGYFVPKELPIVNIDTINDFEYAEFLLNHTKYKNLF